MQIVHRKQRDWSVSLTLKIQVVQNALLNTLNFVKLNERAVQPTENAAAFALTSAGSDPQKEENAILVALWLLNWCSEHWVSKKSVVFFFI